MLCCETGGSSYGKWKLRSGDNESWAAPNFDDHDWLSVAGGVDWRRYDKAFTKPNATGWYRQKLTAPQFDNVTSTVMLSIGIVAGSSTV